MSRKDIVNRLNIRHPNDCTQYLQYDTQLFFARARHWFPKNGQLLSLKDYFVTLLREIASEELGDE